MIKPHVRPEIEDFFRRHGFNEVWNVENITTVDIYACICTSLNRLLDDLEARNAESKESDNGK